MTLTGQQLLDIGMPGISTPTLRVWRSALRLTEKGQREGTDAHRLHQIVSHGMGTVTTTGDRTGRILFAAARTPATTRPGGGLNAGTPHTVLVQTLSPPNWDALAKRNLIHPSPQTLEVAQTWTAGDHAELQMVCSPEKAKVNDAGKKYRVPLLTPDAIAEWARKQLSNKGCTPLQVDMTPCERVPNSRAKELHMCTVRATVEVVAPAPFTEALAYGVGHARAWGAGLVLTRPINEAEQRPRNIPGQGGSHPGARG